MSPTVFREDGYRFFFFSREEARMHVHVVSGSGEATTGLSRKLSWQRTIITQENNLKKSNY